MSYLDESEMCRHLGQPTKYVKIPHFIETNAKMAF